MLFRELSPLLRSRRVVRNLDQLSSRGRVRLGHGADLLPRRHKFLRDTLQFVALNRNFPAPRFACAALCFERDARLFEFPTNTLQFVELNRRFLAPRCARLAFCCKRGMRLIPFSLQRGDPREALISPAP